MANFDPSDFDLDIYAVEVTGLGRGRGFKETEQYSILNPDDEKIILIKNRILTLAKLLMDNDCLDIDEVLSTLSVEAADPEKTRKLEKEVEDLETSLEENMEALPRMVESIEETLNTESYTWRWETAIEDSPLEALKEHVNALIDEYESIVNSEEIIGIITNIEEALVDEYEWNFSADDEPGEALKERANTLIAEYEALAAESEEEND